MRKKKEKDIYICIYPCTENKKKDLAAADRDPRATLGDCWKEKNTKKEHF